MEQRVKIFFESGNLKILEKDINNFLIRTKGTFVSAEYDTILHGRDWGTGVLLTYIPEGRIMKKKSQGQKKIKKVMEEFKAGELHSGSKKGPKVTSKEQAVAIGLSEARKAGAKIPKKKKK